MKYAHEHDCDWISDICKIAAEGGQLECLKYAHEHDCDWISDICKIAAEGGQLECLKYAHEHDCDGFLIFVRLRLKAVNLNA